jgi:hypothetical protein
MAAPLPPSKYQYCNANGVPYAGGTIETYVPGTTTPKIRGQITTRLR